MAPRDLRAQQRADIGPEHPRVAQREPCRPRQLAGDRHPRDHQLKPKTKNKKEKVAGRLFQFDFDYDENNAFHLRR